MSLKPLLLLTLAGLAAPASAENLASAIAAAYDSNPQIGAQRANVRVSDELVPQARAPGRPSFNAQASAAQAGLSFNDNGRTYTAAGQLSQSLYRGGRTRAAENSGENRILAARARLRAIENQVVLDTVTAYADVLRFSRVVELNISQVKVLERELQASKDRFEVGDLTRTDVAQSQARVANAQSNLVVAQNQLAAARQAFQRVVGHLPEDLEPLPPLPVLPGSIAQATEIAEANNPSLLAARFDEAGARYDVKVLEKTRLPTVTANVQAAYQYFQGGGSGTSFIRQGGFFTQNATVTANIPLYQQGLPGSQIREAQAQRGRLLEQISVVSRATQENVVNSFNQLTAARAVIAATQVAVDANTLAAEGVKQENQVGTRTIIELLNAEQEKLTAEVNLVTARRDEQVAGYSLLAAAGAAEAVVLGAPVKAYDPEINARRVRGHWGDDGDDDAPAQPKVDRARASQSLVIGPQQP